MINNSNINFLIFKGTKENHFKDCRFKKLKCKSIKDLYEFFNLDSIFDEANLIKVIVNEQDVYVHVNPALEHNYHRNVLDWSLVPVSNARQYNFYLNGTAKV